MPLALTLIDQLTINKLFNILAYDNGYTFDSFTGDIGAAIGNFATPNFSNLTRPAANTVPIGSVIYNTDTGQLQFSNGVSWVPLDAGGGIVPDTRLIATGNGLAGGGNLTADRTLVAVANPDGSISVTGLGIGVGILATDAQHGNRGGGALHSLVIASGAAGFMSGADKAKLDSLPLTAVPTSRLINTGTGLTGGGDLSADRTISLANTAVTAASYGSASSVGTFTVNAQGQLTAAATVAISGLPESAVTNLTTDLANRALTTTTITAGAGLTGGGDLSTNRTIDVVANADGSILVNANDIQVGVLATDAQHGNRGGGALHANVVAAGAAGFMTGADKTKLDSLVPGGMAVFTTLTRPLANTVAVGTQIWNSTDKAPNFSDGVSNWYDASGNLT